MSVLLLADEHRSCDLFFMMMKNTAVEMCYIALCAVRFLLDEVTEWNYKVSQEILLPETASAFCGSISTL